MNQEFYIIENSQRQGPLSFEELKSRKIQKETLVWYEGLDSWTKAEYLPLLKDILKASPPPMPNSSNQQKQFEPPIPTKTNLMSKYYGYTLASRTERFIASLLEFIIIFIPLIAIFGADLIEGQDTYSITSILTSALFSTIYGAILYPVFSGNLGHKLLGLKVISSTDGSDFNKAGNGALRELLKSIFGLVFIPYFWLLWDKDKQNLYDKVVNTYVVKVNKG